MKDPNRTNLMKTIWSKLLTCCLIGLMPVSAVTAQQDTSTTPADLIIEDVGNNDPETEIGEIILRNDTAPQVLDLLEELTGKIILRRQDLSPVRINFNSRGPLTKAEAVLAIESLLTLNGIMLTDMGGRFMKAVPATNVNSHVPEMLLDSTLEMEASQQIYAKIFKLEFLNAATAGGSIISPLLSQNSNFVLFPKSNALLITDALVNLQRIESVLADADQPQQLREQVEFVKLNFVQASEMRIRIENLIRGSLKSYLEGNTNVDADERTNQLILVTHPGNLPVIMKVIERIDIDAAPLTSSEVFQLRQAKAEEVVPILENIISGQREGREEDARVARNNNRNQPAVPNNNRPPPRPRTTRKHRARSQQRPAVLQFRRPLPRYPHQRHRRLRHTKRPPHH